MAPARLKVRHEVRERRGLCVGEKLYYTCKKSNNETILSYHQFHCLFVFPVFDIHSNNLCMFTQSHGQAYESCVQEPILPKKGHARNFPHRFAETWNPRIALEETTTPSSHFTACYGKSPFFRGRSFRHIQTRANGPLKSWNGQWRNNGYRL